MNKTKNGRHSPEPIHAQPQAVCSGKNAANSAESYTAKREEPRRNPQKESGQNIRLWWEYRPHWWVRESMIVCVCVKSIDLGERVRTKGRGGVVCVCGGQQRTGGQALGRGAEESKAVRDEGGRRPAISADNTTEFRKRYLKQKKKKQIVK